MSRYRRTADLVDLVVSLAGSHRGLTIADICARYEVSRRTGERMRDAIALRFPLFEVGRAYDDRRKRWRIEPGAARGLVRFDVDDDALLDQVAQKLSAYGRDDLAEGVRRIAERVRVLR